MTSVMNPRNPFYGQVNGAPKSSNAPAFGSGPVNWGQPMSAGNDLNYRPRIPIGGATFGPGFAPGTTRPLTPQMGRVPTQRLPPLAPPPMGSNGGAAPPSQPPFTNGNGGAPLPSPPAPMGNGPTWGIAPDQLNAMRAAGMSGDQIQQAMQGVLQNQLAAWRQQNGFTPNPNLVRDAYASTQQFRAAPGLFGLGAQNQR